MRKIFLACWVLSSGIMPAAPLQFSESLIEGGFKYAYGIGVGDLNGDGRLDITLADALEPNSVYWFENEGAGKFTRHLIHHQPPPAERLERHVVADVNGDGHLDIVVVENSTSDLRWLENPGPHRVREPWKAHFISMSGAVWGAYDVDVGDIDGDGLPDVAASGWRIGNTFTWRKNPGSANAVVAGRRGWAGMTIADNLLETRMVRLADMNGDGHLDLVGTATRSGLVLWFENSGNDTSRPWSRHVIDRAGRPAHGQVVDMDGDGDLDVVMALGMLAGRQPSEVLPVAHQVVWYENLGRGLAWRKHVILECFPDAFEAVAADLDNDGSIDVVATAYKRLGSRDVVLAWFHNSGGQAWTMHPLKVNETGGVIFAGQVIVADLDGDGRLDILATMAKEDRSWELRWWRNAGSAR